MDLQQLPEECIAKIISSTSPQDACRLCLLCKTFISAAESDVVWDKFLPPEIPTILSQCGESGLLATKSKKEIFLALCNKPLLIDDGNLGFSLDKWTGKKCYMISARKLHIVWGDTPKYWGWTSHPESMFREVAELLDVCWLELHGELETRLLSPGTLYKAYLVFNFTPEAYGFDHLPAEVSICLEGGEISKQTEFLHYEREMSYFLENMDYSEVTDYSEEMDYSEVETDYSEVETDFSELKVYFSGVALYAAERGINDSKGLGEDAEGVSKDVEGESDEIERGSNDIKGDIHADRYQREDRYPKLRSDGWLEIEMGEFLCEGEEDGQLKMRCLANGAGRWKSGLIVQGIEVRPKRMY